MRATILGLALVLAVGVLGLATDCWWRWECLRWEGHWYTDEACLLQCAIACAGLTNAADYGICTGAGVSGRACAALLGALGGTVCGFGCQFGCSYWFETCTEWRWYQVCGDGGDPWPPIYPDSSGPEVPW